MRTLIAAIFGFALAGAASAQSAGWADGWSGEGNLGAGITTGNTDTVDVGVGLKLSKDFDPWKVSAEGGYDFGQVDGVDNRNRWYVGTQAQRDFTDRIYGFGNISYEEDQFSGFDSRLFVGVGAGYHIFKEKPLTWAVEVAPGYRRSVVADVITPAMDAVIDAGPPIVIVTPATPEIIATPGFTANDFAVRGSSRFAYDFNDKVTFTNDTDVIWTDTSTQTINTAAVTAQLTERISGRVSFEVRNDTNPPDGFVRTDTATRVAVVYGF
jgi:putative salt-induced outer membrane protein